jgi:hypothetical protein
MIEQALASANAVHRRLSDLILAPGTGNRQASSNQNPSAPVIRP